MSCDGEVGYRAGEGALTPGTLHGCVIRCPSAPAGPEPGAPW